MASVKIHAGDFLQGHCEYDAGTLRLRTNEHRFLGEKIDAARLTSLEQATEESVNRLAGRMGWGVAGGALLGPAGLLAGLLMGGRKKEVTFVAVFDDGRKMLATADSKTYTQLMEKVL